MAGSATIKSNSRRSYRTGRGQYGNWNEYYNNSSVAYNYALEVPDYDYPARRPRPATNSGRRRGTRKRIKYVRAVYAGAKISLSTYMTIFVMFACAFACVLSVSRVGEQQRQNSRLTAELKAYEDKTKELMIEVSQSMDLEQIETIARTKLRMSEPAAHQIVYVSYPKQNYTVYYSENNTINGDSGSAVENTSAGKDSGWFSFLNVRLKGMVFKD